MKSKLFYTVWLSLLLFGQYSFLIYAASPQSQFTINSTAAIINGKAVAMEDSAYIKDGRTFIPLAYAAQVIGVSGDNIQWDPGSQTIYLSNEYNYFQLQVGSPVIMFGSGQIVMDASPEVKNGRVCLPIGLIAEAFSCSVSWVSSTRTVTII